MSKTQVTANGAAAPTPPPDPVDPSGNLDRVRDILFGQQAREQDQRLARSEERILRELATLRQELVGRVEGLEE